MGGIKWVEREDGEKEPIYVSNWHDKEIEQYREEHKKKVCDSEAERIVKKIARHFKLGRYQINFHGYKDSGRIWGRGYGGTVTLSHNPSFALICHELCHSLCYKRYKKHISHGSKKFEYQLQRLINYCRKKNFWQDEINRLREPKPQKLEPTKEEIKQQKIAKAEAKIKRYETKIKMYQRKLSKARRSVAMLKRVATKKEVATF